MKYCLDTTLNHQIAQTYKDCLEDFNFLITNEGYLGLNTLFVNNELVVNMDKVEGLVSTALGRKQKNKSMDLAFGIIDPYNSSKVHMLMVELKFNMQSFYGLRKIDLEDKVAGSSSILNNNPSIYKRYIFIFKKENLNEAIHRLARMIPKIDSNFIAIDIETLKIEYFLA